MNNKENKKILLLISFLLNSKEFKNYENAFQQTENNETIINFDINYVNVSEISDKKYEKIIDKYEIIESKILKELSYNIQLREKNVKKYHENVLKQNFKAIQKILKNQNTLNAKVNVLVKNLIDEKKRILELYCKKFLIKENILDSDNLQIIWKINENFKILRTTEEALQKKIIFIYLHYQNNVKKIINEKDYNLWVSNIEEVCIKIKAKIRSKITKKELIESNEKKINLLCDVIRTLLGDITRGEKFSSFLNSENISIENNNNFDSVSILKTDSKIDDITNTEKVMDGMNEYYDNYCIQQKISNNSKQNINAVALPKESPNNLENFNDTIKINQQRINFEHIESNMDDLVKQIFKKSLEEYQENNSEIPSELNEEELLLFIKKEIKEAINILKLYDNTSIDPEFHQLLLILENNNNQFIYNLQNETNKKIKLSKTLLSTFEKNIPIFKNLILKTLICQLFYKNWLIKVKNKLINNNANINECWLNIQIIKTIIANFYQNIEIPNELTCYFDCNNLETQELIRIIENFIFNIEDLDIIVFAIKKYENWLQGKMPFLKTKEE